MADTVLIEGSLTPAMGYLRRGEQAEVALTPNVYDLANKGYIVIKGDAPAPEPTPVTPTAPQGTNQDLVEATPPAPEPEPTPNPDVDNGLVEVTNPDAVDNSLVDITDPGTDAPVSRTATAKSTKK